MDGIPVHLVFGSDEFLVSEKAKAIVSSLLPEADRSLGLEIISGQCSNADEAVSALGRCTEALQTLGFFGARKVVWLRDATFLSDTPTGKTEEVKGRTTQLAGILEKGLQGENVLVITAPQVDKRFAFFKTCASKGAVHEFAVSEKSYQVEREAEGRLADLLRQAGLEMLPEVRDVFLQKAGTDTRQMVNEVEKLSIYVGNSRRVTVSDVDSITSSARQALAWDLADAVGARDLGRALEVLRQLLFQSKKEAPLRLIAGLEGRMRELAFYREAIDQKWLQSAGGRGDRSTLAWRNIPEDKERVLVSDVAKDPRAMHPFRQGLLAAQAKNFTAAEIRRNYRLILDACRNMMKGSVSDVAILELLLVQILAKPASRS